MDYEKAYKDALERAKKLYEQGTITESLSYVFPELKESEDEKIRKRLICGMNALKANRKETFAAIPIDDCIAWLEKQTNQSEEDETIELLAKDM